MSTLPRRITTCLIIPIVLMEFGRHAWPQDIKQDFEQLPTAGDAGKAEFMANCAECHGADGKGTGPRSATLETKPADLTVLAKHNNGVFSAGAVYQLIDGRSVGIRHRSVDMPVWGCRQPSQHAAPRVTHSRRHMPSSILKKKQPAPNAESFFDLPCDPDDVTKQRLLSIVEFLSRIQEK